MSLITVSVALGLALNRRKNAEVPRANWADEDAPRVEIIIPVRDEERNVGPLLETLSAQDYPSEQLTITVVDDGSTDNTASMVGRYANSLSNLNLVKASEPPPGWTGKNNALWTGSLGTSLEAEWLLFVDADTRHDPLMLASVMREALRNGADLLSLIIDVDMESFWERIVVPQVGELYTLLVGTMDQVNSGAGAAANGQFMLLRRSVYQELGALPEVRGDVAEDRAFAAACVAHGYKVRLVYGRNLVSARVYSSLPEMWAGYSKTLFWATGHNTVRTLAVCFALSFYAYAPLISYAQALLAPAGSNRRYIWRHALVQSLPLLLLRGQVCRMMHVPLIYALLYPLSVTVTNLMLLYSLYRVRSDRGVVWKGRTYRK